MKNAITATLLSLSAMTILGCGLDKNLSVNNKEPSAITDLRILVISSFEHLIKGTTPEDTDKIDLCNRFYTFYNILKTDKLKQSTNTNTDKLNQPTNTPISIDDMKEKIDIICSMKKLEN